MNIQDLISSSIIVVYAIPFILYGMTREPYHKIAFIGIFAASAISECIKHIFIKEASPRPQGAADCDILCCNGDQEGKPGMPSSHSATVAFFAAFYFRHTTNPYLRTALIIYALLVMRSRYVKRCHSIPQITVGAILGIGLSMLLDK